MNSISRMWGAVLALGLAGASLALAAPATTAPDDDPILKAMKDEVARAVAKLQLGQLEKPYFVECAVTDEETLQVAAAFGALTQSERTRGRPLRVGVRVGGYDLDNSGFISRSSMYSFGEDETSLVLENDVLALRRDIWLAFDRRYKEALEQLAKKRGVLENKVQAEQIPDFAKTTHVVAVEGRQPAIADESPWKTTVTRLSAIFREFPAIQKSSVRLWVYAGTRYLVNSEGTTVRQPVSLVALIARAETQATDGAPLKHYAPFYAASLDGLPSEDALAAGVRKMAGELTAAAAAPTLEKYIGPVLFTEQASTEVFAQLLAPQLSGRRPPLADDERLVQQFQQPSLVERLGRRVLPPFLAVVDDPSESSFEGQLLLGGYRVDDEGVPGQRVSLIEKGVLKSLLMSRRPLKEIAESNGHARGPRAQNPVAQSSNLTISATNGKTIPELKQALIEACRAQDAPYGLMITRLDNPRISGRDPGAMFFFGFDRGAGEVEMTAPVLIYKVSAKDGAEAPVRGLAITGMTVRTLKEITAAGRDAYAENLPLAEPPGSFRFTQFADIGADAAAGAVVAPAVLFDEVELNRPRGPQQKPAFLSHPYFK